MRWLDFAKAPELKAALIEALAQALVEDVERLLDQKEPGPAGAGAS